MTAPENDARTDRAWQADAQCLGTDPELFFPEPGDSAREAKEVCRICRVQADCLRYALANHEKFSVWGGLSEKDRRKLRQALAVARGLRVQAVAESQRLRDEIGP